MGVNKREGMISGRGNSLGVESANGSLMKCEMICRLASAHARAHTHTHTHTHAERQTRSAGCLQVAHLEFDRFLQKNCHT